MHIYYLHALLATLISYLLVSIIYRDLLWTATFIGVNRYRGKRAVFLSGAILLLLCLLVLPILKDRYEWFDFTMLGYSFAMGLPVAWVLHRILSRLADRVANNPLVRNVPQNLKPKSVTPKSFTSWLIVGVPIGLVVAVILFAIAESLLFSTVIGLTLAGVISWAFARTNWI